MIQRVVTAVTVSLILAATWSSSAAGQTNQTTTAGSSGSECAVGVQLMQLGRPAEAAAAFVKGLSSAQAAQCAADLKALQASDALCGQADELKKLGDDDRANAAYRDVLASVPGSVCASAGLTGADSRSFWDWLGTALTNFAHVLASLALILLVLGVALFVLLWVAARLPITRHFPGIRKLRRPVVSTRALDDSALDTKLGASTTALLRERIATGSISGSHVDLSAGEGGTSEALAGVGELSGEAKALAAVVDLLRRRIRTSQWEASGELHAVGDEGRGLTLALVGTDNYVDFADFWAQADAGPQSPNVSEQYRRLTIPAAAWVRQRVAEDRDPDRVITQNPRSYALFEAGLYWQERGEREIATELYERAIALDERNVGALANLGAMEFEVGNYDRADHLLTRALDAVES